MESTNRHKCHANYMAFMTVCNVHDDIVFIFIGNNTIFHIMYNFSIQGDNSNLQDVCVIHTCI